MKYALLRHLSYILFIKTFSTFTVRSHSVGPTETTNKEKQQSPKRQSRPAVKEGRKSTSNTPTNKRPRPCKKWPNLNILLSNRLTLIGKLLKQMTFSEKLKFEKFHSDIALVCELNIAMWNNKCPLLKCQLLLVCLCVPRVAPCFSQIAYFIICFIIIPFPFTNQIACTK